MTTEKNELDFIVSIPRNQTISDHTRGIFAQIQDISVMLDQLDLIAGALTGQEIPGREMIPTYRGNALKDDLAIAHTALTAITSHIQKQLGAIAEVL